MSITVRTRKGSFWRCGIQHTTTPVTYPDGTFGASQIDALRSEPKLITEEPLAGESEKASKSSEKTAPAKPQKTAKGK